jgi:hypothetical protein
MFLYTGGGGGACTDEKRGKKRILVENLVRREHFHDVSLVKVKIIVILKFIYRNKVRVWGLDLYS